MKDKKHDRADMRLLGRRTFLQRASLAAVSLPLARTLGARSATPFQQGIQPQSVLNRNTAVWVNLRGAPDFLAMLAPANDPFYLTQRNTGLAGTALDPADPANWRLPGTNWWLANALLPLQDVYLAGDLAFVPAAGLVNFNKSHFVAMDRLEFGIPPASQGYNNPITDGIFARALEFGGFASSPVLRGLVMSNLAATAFLEAPKSLAIGNVQDFQFPDDGTPDPALENAVDALHDATSVDILKDASQTAFDSIDYLEGVFNPPPPGLSGIGNNPGEYPNHPFGIQFWRAAAMILDADPPEAIEIDLGGWDDHNNERPNDPAAPNRMWARMDILARAFRAFYNDLSAAPNPHGPGSLMDRTTLIAMGEFGRRVAENGSAGTDHGKGGLMLVMGGSKVNGGVYDSQWTQLGDPNNLQSSDMTDDEGDIKVVVDHRQVLNEAFRKLLNLGTPTDVFFPGFGYSPLGIFN